MNVAASNIGSAISNPKFLAKATSLALLTFGAFQFTKFGMAMFSTFIMSKFGKPTLVRETSKLYTNNYALIPFLQGRKLYNRYLTKRTEANLLKGVILDQKLEDQLREISYAVLNRRMHYAPAKNMLFYGPPGTGKTLFAKKLAMESGMEYAVMVGSDIAPLGP